MVPSTAVDYMEFSEDILKKEDDYERLRYETNQTIKEASDQAISFLYPDGCDGLVSLLPKLYTMNYPVSTFVFHNLTSRNSLRVLLFISGNGDHVAEERKKNSSWKRTSTSIRSWITVTWMTSITASMR